ncbi:MAG: ParB/RepB/Spo0J family partition protein [Candidatus Zophobacter franzmannii]|nr:ParB/RepB/Spo0J family partition protein [Candidatus Zophobacter franzmannii]
MKQKLGKGLDVLLQNIPESTNDTAGITTLKIDIIKPNRYQPRKVFDEDKLNSLAESIKANGIIQPIIVTKRDDTDYELIAGERRLEAAKLAGHERVPVIIRSVSRREQLQYAIIENIQREQLNPIEEAFAFKMMIDDFNYTHEQLAEAMGKSRSAITNTLRLLKLTPEVQQMVSNGELSGSQARSVVVLPANEQLAFAEKIKSEGLSVRDVEELAKEKKGNSNKVPKSKTIHYRNFESQLKERYNTTVQVTETAGKGKVVFHYKTKEGLEQLLRQFNK